MKLNTFLMVITLNSGYQIFESVAEQLGDSCVASRTGAVGTWRYISECKSVIDDIVRKDVFPIQRALVKHVKIVCCPNVGDIELSKPRLNRRSEHSK